MNILQKIHEYAVTVPERVVMQNGSETLTYGQLWRESEILANWLLQNEPDQTAPIAVYGHKHPMMLICFLACVKSGHAYCPIDISVPDARVEMILEALPSQVVFTLEPLLAEKGGKQCITKTQLEILFAETDAVVQTDEKYWVKAEETWYIIFTSGSTGTPKGVQISADCLNHYLDWSIGLGSTKEHKRGQRFLNQAPFSFDLSVMDLYTCLASGGTLYCLEKTVQADYQKLMSALKESGANVWVSTPSFAEMCLAEKSFTSELLPNLEVFLFCGETLANRTAEKLQERFAEAKIINTYGPTESTVAISDVEVTSALCGMENPLPVGTAKPGTCLEIRDENGVCLPEGEKGEIIILGDTVSTGYYQRPDLTEKAFFTELRDGKMVRGYHTGDKGYLKNGMLYYCGRIDLQIKLHGYRIELEDIENNIRRLPGVEHAVVLPNSRGGKITSLTGYLVMKDKTDESSEVCVQKAGKDENSELRAALQQWLPDYMIPKKFVFLNQMPMTNNGKADRKLLGGLKV